MAIDLTPVRKLSLSASRPPGRAAFLCAASGLAVVKDKIYVVADDELALGVFPAEGEAPGELLPLFSGELPESAAERKQKKPDLEAIASLKEDRFPPFGALLALPSGSKDNRTLGSLLPFQEGGNGLSMPQPVDFGPLHAKLRESLPDLNLEGAIIQGESLKLFQRGNARSGKNAVIDLCLKGMLEDLQGRRPPSARHIRRIDLIDLGNLRGVALGFTDAAVFQNGEIWFLAAAEKTDSTYDDGEYAGAVIGRLNEDCSMGPMHELSCPQKPEGLCFSGKEGQREFFVVTDADDPSAPSVLYRGFIPS